MRIIIILSIFFLHFGLATVVWAQTSLSLPEWQEGYLDIHHISTGRGNATYIVMPDGTTMLIDAGDISETHSRTMSPRNSVRRPDRSKSAPGWIVDYIRQFAPSGRKVVLDFGLVTHYHDDHFGEWDETRALSSNGAYKLTGMMEVGDAIPITTLLDRGFTFPIDLTSFAFKEKEKGDEYHIVQTLEEYWKFIEWHSKNSVLRHETLLPGSSSQIHLKYNPGVHPLFAIQNIAVNGIIWTGYNENDVDSLFKSGHYPGENPLSTCLKLSYGPFDYFTGGDISGLNAIGESDLNSVESHIAPVIGPVDIATLNHHGNRDSQNAFYVRTIRPRVWIGQTWSSDHPGHEVLRRITNQSLYPGKRDLFTTDMLESNELVIGDTRSAYKNQRGHVVVRVLKGGTAYDIFVLNDYSKKREIMDRFGPYHSR